MNHQSFLRKQVLIPGQVIVNFISVTSNIELQERSSHPIHRSEEHTSELQSPDHLVCRLLLEKKKNIKKNYLTLQTKDLNDSNLWLMSTTITYNKMTTSMFLTYNLPELLIFLV